MSSTRLSILMKVGVFHMRELQQVSTKQFFLIQHLKWNIGYNTDTLMQNVNVLFDWWAAHSLQDPLLNGEGKCLECL